MSSLHTPISELTVPVKPLKHVSSPLFDMSSTEQAAAMKSGFRSEMGLPVAMLPPMH